MAMEVRDNVEASRFELLVDGQVAGIADYHLRGDTLVVPHTEIDRARRGQGLGAELVRGMLDQVRAAGRSVVPHCWYVAQFMDENPEYRDLRAA